MAGGLVRSYGASSTGVEVTKASSPHGRPVLSNVLICLLVIPLTIIISPISAVAHRDHQQSDIGGVAAAAAGDIIIPSDLSSGSWSGPPRAVVRGQQPGDQSKLRPAEQGALISLQQFPPNRDCSYEVSIRTRCSSPSLKNGHFHSIDIWFSDASGTQPAYTSLTRTWTNFMPCSVETFTVDKSYCFGKVCQVTMWYGGNDGEWIPNYVTVVSLGRKDTICVSSPVGRVIIVNQCTTPAHRDDEYYNNCGSVAAAETANIDPMGEDLKLM